VANSLRLLKLPNRVQTALGDGRITVGHAKVLLGLTDSSALERAAERVLAAGLSVRQTEELVTKVSREAGSTRGAKRVANQDPHVNDLEQRLRERFGAKVSLRYRQGKGALEIRFFSDGELERLLGILGVSVD
jgi:ParB family chromosome partitioning protein